MNNIYEKLGDNFIMFSAAKKILGIIFQNSWNKNKHAAQLNKFCPSEKSL